MSITTFEFLWNYVEPPDLPRLTARMDYEIFEYDAKIDVEARAHTLISIAVGRRGAGILVEHSLKTSGNARARLTIHP
jgi:hypothetical protein